MNRRTALSRGKLCSMNDDPVLATAPLRPGYDRRDLSRYGDASWDLGPGCVSRERPPLPCHRAFRRDRGSGGRPRPAGVSLCAAQRRYARSSAALAACQHPASVQPRAPNSSSSSPIELGACDLGRVDKSLARRYAALLQTGCRPVSVAQLLEVVFRPPRLPRAPASRAGCDRALAGPAPSRVAGYSFTRREPHAADAGGGDRAAVGLVAQVRHPVLARYPCRSRGTRSGCEERANSRLPMTDVAFPPDERRARRRARLTAYLDDRRRQGRGVPIWTTAHNGVVRSDAVTGEFTPPVNCAPAPPPRRRRRAGRAEGASSASRPARPNLVAAAIDAIGTETGGMDTPISIDPDTGQPWRPRFDAKTLAPRGAHAAGRLLRRLRLSDRHARLRGPGDARRLPVDDPQRGRRHRARIASSRSPTRASRANASSRVDHDRTRRQGHRRPRTADRAGRRRLAASTRSGRVLDAQASATRTHISAEIVRQLNVYRDHLNARFGTTQARHPARSNGAPWRITTRQFRRTIAWHIANRPFGTIAGMIQYKHASVAAFEGYAGSSRSGFRAEVEASAPSASSTTSSPISMIIETGAGLSGPAGCPHRANTDAAATSSALARHDRRSRPASRYAREPSLRHCMSASSPTASSILRPPSASSRTTERDRAAPMIALCEPTRCPNACITERHRPAWARAADDARAFLKEKRLSELQRTALTQDIRRIEAVFDGAMKSAAPIGRCDLHGSDDVP